MSKIDDKTIIKNSEEFNYYSLSKLMKEDPQKVRFSQIECSGKSLTEWSKERINIIKGAFRDVMEYVVNKENK